MTGGVKLQASSLLALRLCHAKVSWAHTWEIQPTWNQKTVQIPLRQHAQLVILDARIDFRCDIALAFGTRCTLEECKKEMCSLIVA